MSNFLKLLKNMFKELFLINEVFKNIIVYLKNLFTFDYYQLDYLDLEEDYKEMDDKEKIIFFNYVAKNVKEYYVLKFLGEESFKNVDIIWAKIYSRKFLLKKKN